MNSSRVMSVLRVGFFGNSLGLFRSGSTCTSSAAKGVVGAVNTTSRREDRFVGLTGAAIVHEILREQKVDVVFGYPGGAILPVYDAIFESPHFTFILPRREDGGGHMAEGYARVTGKPGVVLVTSGPGATNMVTPMADALMDGTPMVVLTGQVATVRFFSFPTPLLNLPLTPQTSPLPPDSHRYGCVSRGGHGGSCAPRDKMVHPRERRAGSSTGHE